MEFQWTVTDLGGKNCLTGVDDPDSSRVVPDRSRAVEIDRRGHIPKLQLHSRAPTLKQTPQPNP